MPIPKKASRISPVRNPLAKIGGSAAGIARGVARFVTSVPEAIREIRADIQHDLERPRTPFLFEDGISEDEFQQIARDAIKGIKRIKRCEFKNAKAIFTVVSQSGISEWSFSVDFNAWGHFTNRHWLYSENHDSKIPYVVASRMQKEIDARLPSPQDESATQAS